MLSGGGASRAVSALRSRVGCGAVGDPGGTRRAVCGSLLVWWSRVRRADERERAAEGSVSDSVRNGKSAQVSVASAVVCARLSALPVRLWPRRKGKAKAVGPPRS